MKPLSQFSYLFWLLFADIVTQQSAILVKQLANLFEE